MRLKNKAQVWIETVVYTLIGLTIIAIVLAIAVPQINKAKDKSIVEQTITAMETLNIKISEAQQSPGNTRVVNFKIAKGRLEINGEKNLIEYILENTKLELSQKDVEIKQGNIILKSENVASNFKITLTIRYDNLDLTNNDNDDVKILNAGAIPYKIILENKGALNVGDNTKINFEVM